MDVEGYKSINAALKQGDIEAVVAPQPAEGEDVEYVTVSTAAQVPPARVLIALAEASLLAPRGEAVYDGPQLDPVFGAPGSITFADANYGHSD